MTRGRILIITLLLIPLCSFAQRKKKESYIKLQASMERDAKLADKYLQCFFTGKFKAEKRRKLFPFNETAEVLVISYETMSHPGQSDEPDSLPVISPVSKDNFFINQAKIKEQKTLDTAGIDALTNILFNYGYTPVHLDDLYPTDSHASCYEPRNAVLFLDKSGKVKYYFEVCFSCLRHKWSTSKVKNVIYCDGKYDMLRKFFAKQGVIYGTKPLHGIESNSDNDK